MIPSYIIFHLLFLLFLSLQKIEYKFSFLSKFQLNPQLKHVVRPAISHAIKELIGPVTERAIRIAMHVTEHICKKVILIYCNVVFSCSVLIFFPI